MLLVLSLAQTQLVSEVRLPSSVPPLSATLATSQFNRCGELTEFSSDSWYTSLLTTLSKETFYSKEAATRIWETNKESYATPEDIVAKFGMVTPGAIYQLCYAENTHLVLAVASDYMIRGKIFVYDTSTNTVSHIQEAQNASTVESFMKFGTQQGSFLPVVARFGDGLFMEETIYDLDLTNGTLIPKSSKSCTYSDENDDRSCEEKKL